jgi:hypothetical protein
MIYIKREWNGICPVFMIQFETGKDLIKLFGESLPTFLYSEVLDICQDFWFIEWEKIVVEENLTLTESEIQKIISPARTGHSSMTLIESKDILNSFF